MPRGDSLVGSLVIMDAGSWPAGSWTQDSQYVIEFGDTISSLAPRLALEGSVGRRMFDAYANSSCTACALYHVNVNGAPAAVDGGGLGVWHGMPGSWLVAWYDQSKDTSYLLAVAGCYVYAERCMGTPTVNDAKLLLSHVASFAAIQL
jgi:hypothetical protein